MNYFVTSFVVAGHKAECIKYDVSAQPVSIHVPVTRLLAGLLARISTWNIPVALKELHHKVVIHTIISIINFSEIDASFFLAHTSPHVSKC